MLEAAMSLSMWQQCIPSRLAEVNRQLCYHGNLIDRIGSTDGNKGMHAGVDEEFHYFTLGYIEVNRKLK
jgi:hypothetical protein